jgi:chromosome segregation ATPase
MASKIQNNLLIDTDAPTTTPNSIPSYTARQIEALKATWTEALERDFELVQLELTESREKCERMEAERREMEDMIAVWDSTMNRMIGERETDRMDHKGEVDVLKSQIERFRSDKEEAEKEAGEIVGKYKQARLDNQDLKEVWDGLFLMRLE